MTKAFVTVTDISKTVTENLTLLATLPKTAKLTVSVCSQNNSEFGTFRHRLGLGMHCTRFGIRCSEVEL